MTAVSVTAEAQVTASGQEPAWLPDRQYREGAGILTGNFEMHPGVAADFGYDSNFMRRASDENPVGALQLRVSPSFSIATLGPQRRADGAQPSMNFRFETGLTYHEFIPIRGGTQLDRDVLRSQRNVDGFAKVNLDIQPGRVGPGAFTVASRVRFGRRSRRYRGRTSTGCFLAPEPRLSTPRVAGCSIGVWATSLAAPFSSKLSFPRSAASGTKC